MSHRPNGQPGTDSTPRPQPGEFWVARLSGAASRVVLVIERHDDAPDCTVALVTNEIEFATDRDVLVDEQDTGLGYPVIVETDLIGPLWDSQLDHRLGTLADEYEPLLHIDPDLRRVRPVNLGRPLQRTDDARAVWKRAELHDLSQLTAARVADLDDGEAGDSSRDEVVPVTVGETTGLRHLLDVAEGVSVTVDLLAGERPPAVHWNAGDENASEIAVRLLADLWGTTREDWVSGGTDGLEPDAASRSGRALRKLATAEARFAAHGASLWAIDSSLAVIDLQEILGANHSGTTTDGLDALLRARLPQALEAVLKLPGAVRDIAGKELLDRLLLELLPLRERMNAEQAGDFDAWVTGYRRWEVPPLRPAVAGARTLAARRQVAVEPMLAMAGLIEPDAAAELAVGDDEPGVLTVFVPIGGAVSQALRSSRDCAAGVAMGPRSAERSAIRMEALTGSSAGPEPLWLHVFDRESGEVMLDIPLMVLDQPSAADGGRVGAEVSWDGAADVVAGRFGAVVGCEPVRRIEKEAVSDSLLVALLDIPERCGDFARLLEREFDDVTTQDHLLRFTQAAYQLVPNPSAPERLGTKLAAVDAGLVELELRPLPAARFSPEVTGTAAADLFIGAIHAQRYVVREIVGRLEHVARLPDGGVMAVDAAIEHCRELLADLRDLREITRWKA